MRPHTIQQIREELGTRLRERAGEMEAAIFARILTLGDSPDGGDEEYNVGLRTVVREAVELGITSIEMGPEWNPPAPPAMALQAQRAARSGVSLDAVLRRYATGDRIVGEFIVEEADRFPGHVIRQVMKARSPLVDALMSQAAAHYAREFERMSQSPAQRRAELVEKLLDGATVADPGELEYDLGSWHLGVILVGSGVQVAAEATAAQLGRRALIVPRGPRTAWLWLGGDRRLDPERIERLLDRGPLVGFSLARGEPGRGLDGWRLSHQEALAAHQVMVRKPQRLVRGADVVLVAAMLRDEDLGRSLLRTYLAPLDGPGGAGAVLRETLRAYFVSGHNAATAAAVLKVDRHTVKRRLHKIEELLGRRVDESQAALEVALKLDEVGALPSVGSEVEEPESLRPPHLVGE
ncbi:MAG TPA: helix-turn-helix domain-containing protein [Solirubrobacterales bacterium]|nr:helix-turn-helix domain-containing protein [Solirubrobacterales bacterium]